MLHKDLLLNKEFIGLVESAKKLESLSDLEKGIIRVLNREITKQIKIPKELTEAESLERIRGNMVWREAREKSDFMMYAPHLKKMSPLSPFFLEQKAHALGAYAKHRPACLVFGHPALEPLIDAAERRHRLPRGLLHALVEVESEKRVHRISPAGAMGPGQLMPGTARQLDVEDPFDPEAALDGSARYLAEQLRRFPSLPLAIAAYNAGPGNVGARVPRNGETELYVAKVLRAYARLRPPPPRVALAAPPPRALPVRTAAAAPARVAPVRGTPPRFAAHPAALSSPAHAGATSPARATPARAASRPAVSSGTPPKRGKSPRPAASRPTPAPSEKRAP